MLVPLKCNDRVRRGGDTYLLGNKDAAVRKKDFSHLVSRAPPQDGVLARIWPYKAWLDK